MKKIVLRADGSSVIGMGHVMRCIAIAEMLKDSCALTFAIFSPDLSVKELISYYDLQLLELQTQKDTDFVKDFDALVLDGYWFDETYIRAIKDHPVKLIQVDDLIGAEFFADILINHAIGADYSHSLLHNCKQLLVGSDYALLRKEFFTGKGLKKDFIHPDSITISMGGADPFNYTLKLLRCLDFGSHAFKNITVLTGDSYAHKDELAKWVETVMDTKIEIRKGLHAAQIVDLIQHTDLYFCPASTTVYEAASIGVPIACFLSADNQKNIYEGLVQTGSVKGMGNLQTLPDENLKILLNKTFEDYADLALCVTNQKKLIDGNSGRRINEAVRSLWN